ncbi:ROK family transcriptional regulator, partial [Arthrobacter sp. PAMC 25486]|uniref:ROK family transcriptional regulator n=1 Tax=Arthrobacter sp. PAMC 25486 TaxID=1494608 RepID=UPI00057171A7
MLLKSQPAAPTGRNALRRIRVGAIFSTLLSSGPLARTDLAQLTGYSPSTVTGIVQDLSDAGYLSVMGQKESTGGRRKTLFQLNRSSVTVAVVGFSGTRVWCSLVDLDGFQLDFVEQDFDSAHPVESIAGTVTSVHGRAQIRPVHVVIALPGVVTSDGSLALAPAFGPMAHIRLADELESSTGLRTTVENDVNLIALGERGSGAGNGVDDLVLIHVDEGIGATIIAHGEVLEGASRSAGEIGFLPQSLQASPRGEHGDYETRWNAHGVQRLAAQNGLDLPTENVIGFLCESTAPQAQELLAEVIQAWAFAAIVCICIVNPARVIFSGHAVHLNEGARGELREMVQRSAPSPTDVVFAELGSTGLLHGAIAKVLKVPETLFTEVAS